MSNKRLRLLKVVVQPVFVIDDGEKLTEVETQSVVVPADRWPTYATSEFLEAVDELQQELDQIPE